jgi:hypothetical protein
VSVEELPNCNSDSCEETVECDSLSLEGSLTNLCTFARGRLLLRGEENKRRGGAFAGGKCSKLGVESERPKPRCASAIGAGRGFLAWTLDYVGRK